LVRSAPGLALSAGSAANVCNQWHELVGLSALERCLLPLLDGAHSHAMLADHLADEVGAGRLRFIQNDQPLTDPSVLKEFARQQVVLGLAALRRKALLVA
jgi:methyltransferase-like protein